jgi:uncharacterized protein
MLDVDVSMIKASRQFQIFVKPIGAICNLGCEYCYYLKKKDLYPDDDSFRMPDDILETYIVQHIQASPGTEIHFSWHGGEPTLLGLDYFRKIVALQQKHKPSNCSIINNMQTNGILIDEAWCRFLSEEGFSVGLSLDGPREMHDVHRSTLDGKSTHKQVLRAHDLLKLNHVPCDILCVVNAGNVKYPSRVYRFFKEIGAQYLGFIPLVEPAIEGPATHHAISAEAWGEFLCAIFDEWLSQDIGRMKVQIFEEVARAALGHEHALCIFRENCGDVPAIEHNGDFFSCDHFVDTDHRLGNIIETPIVELLESPAQRAFGNAKSEMLPRYCRECEVLQMCHGGCPKDRFIRTPDGEAGLNYLCAGYKHFFSHSRSFAKQLATQSHKRSIEAQSKPLGATYNRIHPKVSRNDPCPCGSGRKYKNCCLGK